MEDTIPKASKIRKQSEQYEENFVSGFTHEKIKIKIISTKRTEEEKMYHPFTNTQHFSEKLNTFSICYMEAR